MEKIIITIKGKRSFDTREEANEFKKSIGNKYKCMWECRYPDITFYIVEFHE